MRIPQMSGVNFRNIAKELHRIFNNLTKDQYSCDISPHFWFCLGKCDWRSQLAVYDLARSKEETKKQQQQQKTSSTEDRDALSQLGWCYR